MSAAWRTGRLVRQWREREGLSLRAAARLGGVSHVYLSQIESGERLPSAELLVGFSRRAGLGGRLLKAYLRDAHDSALEAWLAAERDASEAEVVA